MVTIESKLMPTPTFFNLPEEKREFIERIAVEELSSKGFAQASVTGIVTRANIAKGSFYQYFENKLDLYEWLFEEAGRHKLAYIEGEEQPDPARLWDWLERVYLAGLRFAKEEPRLARLAQTMMEPTSVPELRAIHAHHRQQAHDYFVEILTAAQKAGSIRNTIDVHLAAHILLHVLGDGVREVVMERTGVRDLMEYLDKPEALDEISDKEIQKIVHSAVDILRHGLGGTDA